MHSSLIVTTLVVLLIHQGQSIDCPKSSGKWCDSVEIARACRVSEQCSSFVWKTAAGSDRVNLSIYYETLCPDCRQFIANQVWNAYQSILDIVNITFVPYGNAKELYRPETKLYQYYCQHGADECYGNLIHVRHERSIVLTLSLLFSGVRDQLLPADRTTHGACVSDGRANLNVSLL
jgi:hypothetical protein